MVDTTFALLARPAAMIAAFAGIIVLSFIVIAWRRAKRRRNRRLAAEKEARRIVGKMRHCPRFSKTEDRKLAVKFAVELDAIVTANGFALHEVGTSRSEIDRILYLVREDVVADPRSRWPNALKRVLDRKEPGTPGLPINTRRPADAAGEQVLFTATFSVEDLVSAATDGAEAPETVEIIVEEPVAARTEPDQVPSDPMRALRALDDGDLDDFIDQRILAIQVNGDE